MFSINIYLASEQPISSIVVLLQQTECWFYHKLMRANNSFFCIEAENIKIGHQGTKKIVIKNKT